jgi:hypothetical protein
VSVINKMLRDLDARRAGGALPDLQRQGGPDALLGTSSVGASGRTWPTRYRLLGVVALLLLAGAALTAWYVVDEAPVVAAALPAPVASAAAPAASAPAPAASAAASAPLPLAAASAPVGDGAASSTVKKDTEPLPQKMLATSPDSERRAPPAAAKRPVVSTAEAQRPRAPPAVPAVPAAQPRAVTAPAPVPAPAPRVAASATAAVGDGAAPADAAQRRLLAARETVAQAQGLWSAGSREAALAMVGEALALAERSSPADPQLLALLVREQTRMDLALGRTEAALALLSRLEPALATQADLWAVRGNAAQRLGRHSQAVQAYQRALQLRPDEPRWMLGAAVSLAAQGQLDAAATLAEQARALGPVSPQVWSYLRQAGVPVH